MTGKKTFWLLALALLPGLLSALPKGACAVDWKGSEFSSDAAPKWLCNLFERGNAKAFYKEFKLDKGQKIFFAKAVSGDLDTALLAAKTSALQKSQKENSASLASNLVKIADHWIEYEDGGQTLYEAYWICAAK